MIKRMPIRIIIFCAMLAWITLGLSSAEANTTSSRNNSAGTLTEQLRQRFESSPETLMVRSFNGSREYSWSGFGLAGCGPPRLISPAPTTLAMTTCFDNNPTLLAPNLRNRRTWVVWEHRDDEWQTGEVVALEAERWEYGRRQPVRQDKERTSSSNSSFRTFTHATAAELRAIEEAWLALEALDLHDLDDLEFDLPSSWPPGLMALDQEGRLLLRDNRLAGLGTWQSWMEEREWPAVVKGVAGMPTMQRISYESPPTPVLLLESLMLNGRPHAIVLAQKSTLASEETVWESEHWGLILIRLDIR
ncbi:hypothetical protein ACUY1T_21920 [Billgrantia sp. Q4P2]|uniref:hypothetical protein n=1 Tax=Billgrantia sp. Q4P2 TaxID=3463857 RepID=UPI0040578410